MSLSGQRPALMGRGVSVPRMRASQNMRTQGDLQRLALREGEQQAQMRGQAIGQVGGALAGNTASQNKLATLDPDMAKKILDLRDRITAPQRLVVAQRAKDTAGRAINVLGATGMQQVESYRKFIEMESESGRDMSKYPPTFDARARAMLDEDRRQALTIEQTMASNAPAGEGKAPTMKKIYTPGGEEQMVQWSPESNTWEKIGGAKAPTPPISIDLGEKVAVERVKTEMSIHEKRLDARQKAATQYSDLMPRLQTIVLGLESGNVETGPISEALLPLRGVLKNLGFTVDENLSQAEQVNAAMKFLAPRMRVQGSGSTSNMEMKEFRRAGPQYNNTVQGNILLARSFMQIQRYNEDAVDLAMLNFATNGTTIGEGDYIEENLGPVFPKPMTQQEFNKIRPGTVYYDTEQGKFFVRQSGEEIP